jgi:hypothetical protein
LQAWYHIPAATAKPTVVVIAKFRIPPYRPHLPSTASLPAAAFDFASFRAVAQVAAFPPTAFFLSPPLFESVATRGVFTCAWRVPFARPAAVDFEDSIDFIAALAAAVPPGKTAALATTDYQCHWRP